MCARPHSLRVRDTTRRENHTVSDTSTAPTRPDMLELGAGLRPRGHPRLPVRRRGEDAADGERVPRRHHRPRPHPHLVDPHPRREHRRPHRREDVRRPGRRRPPRRRRLGRPQPRQGSRPGRRVVPRHPDPLRWAAPALPRDRPAQRLDPRGAPGLPRHRRVRPPPALPRADEVLLPPLPGHPASPTSPPGPWTGPPSPHCSHPPRRRALSTRPYGPAPVRTRPRGSPRTSPANPKATATTPSSGPPAAPPKPASPTTNPSSTPPPPPASPNPRPPAPSNPPATP